jgi:hypothetical protein
LAGQLPPLSLDALAAIVIEFAFAFVFAFATKATAPAPTAGVMKQQQQQANSSTDVFATVIGGGIASEHKGARARVLPAFLVLVGWFFWLWVVPSVIFVDRFNETGLGQWNDENPRIMMHFDSYFDRLSSVFVALCPFGVFSPSFFSQLHRQPPPTSPGRDRCATQWLHGGRPKTNKIKER